jgi:hypothetical protein
MRHVSMLGMHTWVGIWVLLLEACVPAGGPDPKSPGTSSATAVPGNAATSPAVAAQLLSQTNRVSSGPDPRFYVPPLPPDAPIPRWQQFCWAGSAEVLAHMDGAGAQGWELVNVSVAMSGDVAVPHSTGIGMNQGIVSEYIAGRQVWIACFKRLIPPGSGPPASSASSAVLTPADR